MVNNRAHYPSSVWLCGLQSADQCTAVTSTGIVGHGGGERVSAAQVSSGVSGHKGICELGHRDEAKQSNNTSRQLCCFTCTL